jgi:uncharacterized membrane protein HdeD (DUF308 family)
MARTDGLLGNMGGDALALCQRTWWVFLIGGIAGIIFGVLAFREPLAAWLVVSIFFAAAIMVDGVFNVIGAIRNREKDGWWVMLLIGVLGAVAGGYALLNPIISMKAFLLLVAIEAVLLGMLLLTLGYKVRETAKHEWLLYLAGATSIGFGALIVMWPGVAGVSIIWAIATWAIIIGVLRVVFAFKVRSMGRSLA